MLIVVWLGCTREHYPRRTPIHNPTRPFVYSKMAMQFAAEASGLPAGRAYQQQHFLNESLSRRKRPDGRGGPANPHRLRVRRPLPSTATRRISLIDRPSRSPVSQGHKERPQIMRRPQPTIRPLYELRRLVSLSLSSHSFQQLLRKRTQNS